MTTLLDVSGILRLADLHGEAKALRSRLGAA